MTVLAAENITVTRGEAVYRGRYDRRLRLRPRRGVDLAGATRVLDADLDVGRQRRQPENEEERGQRPL